MKTEARFGEGTKLGNITIYNGIEHRSFTEAMQHNILDGCGFLVLYEAYKYPLPGGETYRPDFYSQALDLFIEAKGYKSIAEARDIEKITFFKSRSQDDNCGLPDTNSILVVGSIPELEKVNIKDMSDTEVFNYVYMATLVAYNQSADSAVQYYELNGKYQMPCLLLNGTPGLYSGVNQDEVDVPGTGRVYRQALTYGGYRTVPTLKRDANTYCDISNDSFTLDLESGERLCPFEVVDAYFYVQGKGKRDKLALRTPLNVYGKSGTIYRADNNMFFWLGDPKDSRASRIRSWNQHFMGSLDRTFDTYNPESIQKKIVGACGYATFKIKDQKNASTKQELVPNRFAERTCLQSDM